MPIYEFRCESCDHRFEKLLRSIDPAPAGIVCPVCQGPDVRRLISAPVVHTGQAGSDDGAEESAPPKPPVFGRKELNEALRNRKG